MHRFLVRCRAHLYLLKIRCIAYWYLYIIPFIFHKSLLQIDLSKLDNEIARLVEYMRLNNIISHTEYIEYCKKKMDHLKSLKVDL